MYKYLIDDIALIELRDVENTYISYFAKMGDLEKGIMWSSRFYEDYKKSIDEIKENPYKYSKCCIYPFNCIETQYRYFTVGWFTIFYTVEDDSFTIWHIRSSKSDFSTLSYR